MCSSHVSFCATVFAFLLLFAVEVCRNMLDNDTPQKQAPWQQSVYDQLHRLAERALGREAPGHSLQPTLLVNDAYLYLLKQRHIDPAERSQVIAAGANFIRRLLVDYARRRQAKKRGGKVGRGIPLHISVADDANTLDVVELRACGCLQCECPIRAYCEKCEWQFH